MGIRFMAIVSGAALASAAPLVAETPQQLDALATATAQPGTGVALARKQIAAGDMLDALGTLERVIINFPQGNEARMLHAGVMCRLADRQGALVELDQLRNRQISDALWAEANAACSGRQGR